MKVLIHQEQWSIITGNTFRGVETDNKYGSVSGVRFFHFSYHEVISSYLVSIGLDLYSVAPV